MKKLNILVSFIMVFVLTFAMASTGFAADKSLTTAPLYFNEDGSFRVMHVTDTHLSKDNVKASIWLIANACDREKPDLIMLTGDICKCDTVEETKWFIEQIMSVFQSRDIPVAVCFGNHDSENGVISREDLMALYNEYPCSISIDDGEMLSGCSTYNVPLYSSIDGKMKFNLWVFDSGDYDSEGHYSNVQADQVEWYKQTSAEIEKQNGGKINSFVFQHIIVPEVYDGLKKMKHKGAYVYNKFYTDDEFYAFDPEVENHGTLHESPSCGYYNHGQFDALVERGDVLAMFTGHDHSNSFSVKYKGINITNSLSTRYNGDAYSSQYGYRIIDLDENDTSTYQTRTQRWYNAFSACDSTALRKAGDKDGAKLVDKVNFLGFIELACETIGHLFVRIFIGRTVYYK